MDTQTKLRTGDRRADGYYFTHYRTNGKPIWTSPKAYFRTRVTMCVTNCRINARNSGLPFDLTIDYLISIWPHDGRCPILGTDLIWGEAGGRNSSPSLDKMIPALGYTMGNVTWVSSRANRLKQDFTAAEIAKILNYMTPLPVLSCVESAWKECFPNGFTPRPS